MKKGQEFTTPSLSNLDINHSSSVKMVVVVGCHPLPANNNNNKRGTGRWSRSCHHQSSRGKHSNTSNVGR
jgi:hypothetical protein